MAGGTIFPALPSTRSAREIPRAQESPVTPGPATQEHTISNDFETVKRRLLDEVLRQSANARSATEDLNALRSDGSWPDIRYDNQDPSNWSPARHLSRLLTLAIAYRKEASPLAGDKGLKQGILAAYDFWMRHDFKSGNWWWNQIGVPRTLYRIMLVMEPQLSPRQLQQGLDILKRGQLGMTGENLVWLAEVTIARGCLAGDAKTVAEAFERIRGDLRITGAEGIQVDDSFYQHGTQFYSGGYGRGFAMDCPRFAALARGTRFAFGPEPLKVLSGYLLDGEQWMVWGSTFDYSACGREISRKGAAGTGALLEACRDMLKLSTPRRSEFESFAARLQGKGPRAGETFTGNKHFWRADFMVQRRSDYYVSVRLTSDRLLQTESLNGENLEGRHLADGVNYILRRGDEYRGIFPVWDWQRLPGTTAELLDEPMRVPHRRRGERSFAGGVSDGRCGLAAMDFARGALTARKAWFFFDREFVCLGADITCPTDHPVVTTINQCHLKGEVVAAGPEGQRVLGKGDHRLVQVRWVWHDGVGYLFPTPAALVLKNEVQRGSWWRINHSYGRDPVSEEVFSLWFEHGRRVKNGSYAYLVAPAASRVSMGALWRRKPVRILANRPVLQAVCDASGEWLEAVFYKPGAVGEPDGLTIGVDRPCLVLARRMKSGLELAVSNPLNHRLDVRLTINRHLHGEGCEWRQADGTTQVDFSLPDGLEAGKSVVRRFEQP